MKFDTNSLGLPQLFTKPVQIAAVIALVLFCIAMLPLWWYFVRALPLADSSVSVVIPKGASGRTVAELTVKAGFGVTPETLLAAIRVQGRVPSIHAGRYRFEQGTTLHELVSAYLSGAVEPGVLRITDGMTIWQLRQAVQSNPDIEVTTAQLTDRQLLERLGIAYKHPEGLFAPETYKFNSGTTDVVVYKTAYARQQQILEKAWKARAPKLKLRTPYEALILASIIEKETAHPEDRRLVSSVFHNRLRIWMPLQTDPAVIYGIGEKFTGNIRKRDLQRPGPYNTYINYGLPPSPIAMPTKASIEAALNPARSKYLYFVARGDGTTQFSNALVHHNVAVEKFQKSTKRK